MKLIRRSAAMALAGISVLGAVAAPLATPAEAATNTVTLRAIGNSELLTDVSSIGFVTMKTASPTWLDQKWTQTDVTGPGGTSSSSARSSAAPDSAGPSAS